MNRILCAAALCFAMSAFAADKAAQVEIIRGPKRAQSKTAAKKSTAVVNDPEQQAAADANQRKQAEALNAKQQELDSRDAELKAKEQELNAREAELTRSSEEAKKRDEAEKAAKAKQQKQMEDLARQVQGQYGHAADALSGE